MFKRYFSDRFRELFGSPPLRGDGLDVDALRSDLARVGLVIPTALFDYYTLAGRHWVNTHYNRLLPVAELYWIDDYLVFMEENQCVVLWGIRRTDLGQSDPIVHQGVNNQSVEWYEEDHRLSRFLIDTWKCTATGGEESSDAEAADA